MTTPRITVDVAAVIRELGGFDENTSTHLLKLIFSQLDPQMAIVQKLGELMAKIDDIGARIDQSAATAERAFSEIRTFLDEVLASQITPAMLAAAVEAAKAAQLAGDTAAFESALDPLIPKADALDAALTKLDNAVPPAVPPAA